MIMVTSEKDNEIVDNQCWYCGRAISNPRYFVTVRLSDFGIESDEMKRIAIHKSCYWRVEYFDRRKFINGLEDVKKI